ncbi:hypothetical protein EDB81DRAFT_759967 [Dactylonectria macrodidyma]|uniref:Gfo/Idh/MocA-like oxidoreductase C-terminal domain-containing protein n=1 Tax=Dactylonectria macrodidyma TaxID=307937 RepID=A0A9P9ETD0_9HYPO|nr:hypothetical protein EDB81DRAFT_759967 [Dactylonectria macrodidyma]
MTPVKSLLSKLTKRNDQTTAPSLLTKSCHDVDFLLWMLCSSEEAGQGEPHLPSTVSSSGSLHLFRKSRKPATAGSATNCMRCPLGDSGCSFSAKNIYLEIQSRNWFGGCVFESDNNVCDDQYVKITWPELTQPAKTATLHMVAQTKKMGSRYSNIYGELGEVHADSRQIVVEDFSTGETKTHYPHIEGMGHGGGDQVLVRQFVLACDRVKNHGWEAPRAQNELIACTLDEVLRSYAMVFAA